MTEPETEMIEGFGNEVIYFGLATIICSYLLYKTVQYMFSLMSGPEQTPLSDTPVRAGRVRTSDQDCCICLGETQLAVETNCGHVYCGPCILEVARRASILSAMSCPYCRQRITLLLPYFSEDERNTAEPGEIEVRSKVITELNQYNRRFSGEPRSLMEHIRDLPVLLRHLWSHIWSGEGLHFAFQLRVAVLGLIWIAYFLSPLDLLPEALFGLIGLLDDLLVFIMISMHLAYFFRQVVTNMFGDNIDIPGINQ